MSGPSGEAPENEPPTRTRRLLRWLTIAVALVVVFGWLLPQIIDYELVWEAITGLSVQQLLVLVLLTVVRLPTEAAIYRAMLPGLRLGPGSEAYLSSNVAANFMPPRRHR